MTLPDKPQAYKPLFNFVLEITAIVVFLWLAINYINFKEPSNNIINGAFAVLLALSAICLSLSDKIKDDQLCDRLLFAAERLVHGALLIIIASALRYVAVGLLDGKSMARPIPCRIP